MLSVTGINRFYYLRDFHDMRCKYDRVRSVIHRQLDREPEEGDVFIMMSKDRRLVRLTVAAAPFMRNVSRRVTGL